MRISDLEVDSCDSDLYIVANKMKVLTVEDKVASVGNENEPRVDDADVKSTKEELNR